MPFDFTQRAPQRIAVIGGGIAGLASAWSLHRHHQVTLFEAAPRFGGHARTVTAGRNGDRPVDTGFIVFNHVTYPHLTAMFRDLEVPVKRSDMSFGVSLDRPGRGRVEYALRNLDTLFAQRRRLFDPGFYAMIRDILRFNAGAEAELEAAPDLTIAELTDRMGLGRRFREDYLFPFCGAIWSTPDLGIGAFPARALLRFMRNHGLMSRQEHHQWWTVEGGSVAYVSRLVQALRQGGAVLQAGAAVRQVSRRPGGVSLRLEGDQAQEFDQVVLATHPDQALSLLADCTPEERAALGAIRFQTNHTVLHADPSVMPRNRKCWSAWVSHGGAGESAAGVTYWMNRLQGIPQSDPLFVTLNPRAGAIDPRQVQDEISFRHPVFDRAALAAQQQIAAMQGRAQTWFAGAWLRNGFHEDGFASAMRIARRLTPATILP